MPTPGMIQMAADKKQCLKKNQIKGCTQELMFIANKQTKKREGKKENGQKSTTCKVKNLKTSYILP